MKLILGLGNPGEKYEQTRHNLGFMAVDLLAEKLGLAWRESSKLKAWVAKKGELVLAKPTTFMNNSGFAAAAVLKFYKLSAEDLAVVHDDLDIDFGKWKLSVNSRSAGHNGVQSIIEALGTKNFSRYRIGIRVATGYEINPEKYVLEKFRPEELSRLEALLPGIAEELVKGLSPNALSR